MNLDITNPFALWRSLRDVNMEAWSTGTARIVNTEAFSQALGHYLDSYLIFYAPFFQYFDKYQEATLARLNLPSRNELTTLARRMTNIEMRLDDLDGKIDQLVHAVRAQAPVIVEMLEEQFEHLPAPARDGAPADVDTLETRLQTLDHKTEQLLQLLEALHTAAPAPRPQGAPARLAREPEPPSADDIAEDTALEGFQDAAS